MTSSVLYGDMLEVFTRHTTTLITIVSSVNNRQVYGQMAATTCVPPSRIIKDYILKLFHIYVENMLNWL